MTPWIFTGIVVLVVLVIVRAEIVCGRRSKHFLETINPEIDELTRSATAKYQARFGRAPTAPCVVSEPPRRGLFRRS